MAVTWLKNQHLSSRWTLPKWWPRRSRLPRPGWVPRSCATSTTSPPPSSSTPSWGSPPTRWTSGTTTIPSTKSKLDRDGEVPQMTTSPQSTSPRIWEDLAPGTGLQYRSLLCPSHKNRTSSPLQVLNFRGLVWTACTVLPVLPIPEMGIVVHVVVGPGNAQGEPGGCWPGLSWHWIGWNIILPSCTANSAYSHLPKASAWQDQAGSEMTKISQPNPGPQPPGSPCRMLVCVKARFILPKTY